MKEHNQQQADNNETNHMEQQFAYPDISKVNTKTVVLISFIVVVIVFILSITIPQPSTMDSTTEQSTSTEVTTESPDTEENTSGLFDMGSIEKASVSAEVFPILQIPLESASPGFHEMNGITYYLRKGNTPFTGWLKINNNCYYIQKLGQVATGWQEIGEQIFYFAENGIMQTNQWIDDKYLGTDGVMFTNAVTPDDIYVGKDGLEDNTLGTTDSTDGLTELRQTLENMISGYSGSWSVYVKDIANNEYLSINNVQYFSASLIKLYCAAAAYDLMDKGILEKTDRIDSLMTQMISISDNDAFSLMVMACAENNSQITGRTVIQDYINQESYKDTTITSMLLPTKYKAPSSPGRNYTTVEDCGLLLEKIYKGKCVNPESSKAFLDLLLNQVNVSKIPAGLPEGTICANKTGDTDEFQHDAAIVYSPGGDYIITIMSSDCGSAITNIQQLSEAVYIYFN